MGSRFHDLTMIYYNYLVCILYRAKTMSNNNHSLSLIKTIKVFYNLSLIIGIKRIGRLI